MMDFKGEKKGGGARKNESTNKKKPVKQNACLTSAYQWRVELACSALGLRQLHSEDILSNSDRKKVDTSQISF